VVACSVLFIRNMGDKLLKHRNNINVQQNLRKMPTPVTVSTYDGTANNNMGFC
jgi:hypothetical protein